MENKTNEKLLGYSKKYLTNFEDIKVRVTVGEREVYKDYAVNHGWKSLNQCVVSVLDYIIVNNLTAEDFKIHQTRKD